MPMAFDWIATAALPPRNDVKEVNAVVLSCRATPAMTPHRHREARMAVAIQSDLAQKNPGTLAMTA